MSNDSPSTSRPSYSSTANNNHNERGNQIVANQIGRDQFVGNNIVINPAPTLPTQTCEWQPPFPPQELVGQVFLHNVEWVVKSLQDPKSSVLGVWGMGGVGKTTLLKFIFNKLKKDPNIAGAAYWVDVTQHCNGDFKLQEKIAKVFGVDLSGKESLDSRSALLYSKLRSMRRVVLVLDDVWDDFDVASAGIPLTENKCKIIFTTRNEKVCRGMLCRDFVLSVKTLSTEDALELFIRSLRNYADLTGEMQVIAAMIAEKCHCLPLAIVAIAGSMRRAGSIHEWRDALNELRDLDREHDTMEKKVLHILKFSYQRLREPVQKICFLSCAFYLEFHAIYTKDLLDLDDHKIERNNMIDIWITEGLLDFIRDRSEQLSKAHTIMNQLESACLLEPSTNHYKRRCLGMHDLMREMAIGITKKDAPFLVKSGAELIKLPGKELWYKDLVKVSLTDSNIKGIPHDMSPETPNLIALRLNDNKYLCEIPESFFVQMKALKILDLSRTSIERLPDSISELEDLRELHLDDCTKLKYVPSVEKLTKLRVLNLPYIEDSDFNRHLAEAPKGIEALKCLEKLRYCRWKRSDVIRFNNFIESAQSLTHYALQVYDDDSDPTIDLEGQYEKEIHILGEFGDGRPTPTIPPTAEGVCFDGIELKNRNNLVDVLPSLAGVTELKFLSLDCCKGVEYIATSASSCPQLDTLQEIFFENPDGLKRITKLGAFSFYKLEEVRIWDCDSLEVGLPVKSGHHHMHPLLPNLLAIVVRNCPELKEIFELNTTSSSSSEIDVPNFDPIFTLPKLTRIELNYAAKLHSICRGLLICPSLKYNEVWECPELNLLVLSEPLFCDKTPATWASIPQQDDNPEWWERLQQDYPEDAALISSYKASGPSAYQNIKAHGDKKNKKRNRKFRAWGSFFNVMIMKRFRLVAVKKAKKKLRLERERSRL